MTLQPLNFFRFPSNVAALVSVLALNQCTIKLLLCALMSVYCRLLTFSNGVYLMAILTFLPLLEIF